MLEIRRSSPREPDTVLKLNKHLEKTQEWNKIESYPEEEPEAPPDNADDDDEDEDEDSTRFL